MSEDNKLDGREDKPSKPEAKANIFTLAAPPKAGGVNSGNQLPSLNAISQVLENEKVLTEYQEFLARVRRAAYLAYIKAGFTEEQALRLCVQ